MRRAASLLASLLALSVLVFYIAGSRNIGGGSPIMPVDDAYIHFQYAKQIARGEPYIYNPGLAPTSGATSFLYPYLLAVGYTVGFHGLSLGYVALAVGALALAGAALAVYLLVRCYHPSHGFALTLMVAFALNGATAWHFMSGMETGLMVCFTLWTLYAFVAKKSRLLLAFAGLLALTRPEGSLMAMIAAAVFAVENRKIVPLVVSILAASVQPMVNLMLTDSLSASGNQAKSLLGMIPAYPDVIVERIAGNFVRMWHEFFIGVGEHGILYLLPLLAVVALTGLWQQRSRPALVTVIVSWLLIISLAVSTLDTAFWHFKRYQLPLMALFFPLAGWQGKRLRSAAIPILIFSGITFAAFYSYYLENVRNVVAQPLAMARWLSENTPPDAVIAVHDVGMMRYLGERTTIDMVGLTTAGAANAWRNGPGAVGEFLSEARPDYVAAYTNARGLGYLAATGIYGDLLAGFTATFDPRFNVALGGEFQGIFQPTWEGVEAASTTRTDAILHYLEGMRLIDLVDVADLDSEKAHDYHWSNHARYPGFVTEFYQQSAIGCSTCIVTDGGRLITGEEAFTLTTLPDQDLLLVTRVHPVHAGTFDVYANDQFIATRWIPAQPGEWLEVPTLIPAKQVANEFLRIRIVPNVAGGPYMPYIHLAYQGEYNAEINFSPDVRFQDGKISAAVSYEIDEAKTLHVQVKWGSNGDATGDYRLFVHVYDDPDQPPVAQAQDQRPGGGAMPPGNWLPGTLSDEFRVDLAQIPDGNYHIAIGLYDPMTGERLMPESTEFEADATAGRLFIGRLTINAR
jgi:hypothetical protein